jgi:hypothetical protein
LNPVRRQRAAAWDSAEAVRDGAGPMMTSISLIRFDVDAAALILTKSRDVGWLS